MNLKLVVEVAIPRTWKRRFDFMIYRWWCSIANCENTFGPKAGWCFETWPYFSIQLGISSSQLTKSIIFQRGRAQPPNRKGIEVALFRNGETVKPPRSWHQPGSDYLIAWHWARSCPPVNGEFMSYSLIADFHGFYRVLWDFMLIIPDFVGYTLWFCLTICELENMAHGYFHGLPINLMVVFHSNLLVYHETCSENSNEWIMFEMDQSWSIIYYSHINTYNISWSMGYKYI